MMFTTCSWVSTSWQWSVNCKQIGNKQLHTQGEIIHKTIQNTAHTKQKAKHTQQENKHKTNKLKNKTINQNTIGRFHPFTGHDGPQGEQRYSSTLFQTSALEGGEGSASRPGSILPPGKTRYPLYRRLSRPQGWSGQVRKISPHRDSIPGPSSPQAVAIPTTLPGPYQNTIKGKRHNANSNETRHLVEYIVSSGKATQTMLNCFCLKSLQCSSASAYPVFFRVPHN